MSALPPDVPIIGARRHVAVTDRRILFPADVQFAAGGMAQPGCDMHIRIVDIANESALYIPLPHQVVEQLLPEADHVVTILTDTQPTEGSSHA